MMRRYGLAALSAAVLVLAPSVSRGATWDIDPVHTTAQFKVRHLMISNVTGGFGKVTGTVSYDPADVTRSSVEAVIDAGTIDTRQPQRDTHLKSDAFFDVAKYPTLTFKSRKVEKAGEGKLKVTGDLTIRGVTKEVVLDVAGPFPEIKDPWGKMRSGASASTTINRQDFGVSWNQTLDTGGVVVGDEVAITIDVEMVKKP